jgi:UPF0716 protein FxsA
MIQMAADFLAVSRGAGTLPVEDAMRFTMLPAAILFLPLAEIAGFVLVGRAIGLLATLGLVVASFVIGVMLLRSQGIGILRRMSAEGRNGTVPGRELLRPAMFVFASLLLIIPGFISDIVAILICIPAVRDFAWRYISRRFVVASSKGGFTASSRPSAGPGRPSDAKVVDLDEEDFHREPDGKSPWSGKRLGD